jgi:hypothetical protein
MIDETSAKFLKCCAELIDDSKLYITESYTAGKTRYSYHWQSSSNQMIVRWDNAPHYRHHSTFPHHKHEGTQVFECPRVLIDEVLQEIEQEIENRFPTSDDEFVA